MPWFRRRPVPPITRTYGPLDNLLALTPGEFEEEVARLLEQQGYRDVRRVSDPDDQPAVECPPAGLRRPMPTVVTAR
ncbi:MAG: restriction endonuclease [Chloroflexota bacterium]|nr:restriction endonuclease [Chloroflexota bacterium]